MEKKKINSYFNMTNHFGSKETPFKIDVIFAALRCESCVIIWQ